MWPNRKCLFWPPPLLHPHLPHCSCRWPKIRFPSDLLGSHVASDVCVYHGGPSLAAGGTLTQRPCPSWVMPPPHFLWPLPSPLQPQGLLALRFSASGPLHAPFLLPVKLFSVSLFLSHSLPSICSYILCSFPPGDFAEAISACRECPSLSLLLTSLVPP